MTVSLSGPFALAVCADDFGLSASIDTAIMQLALAGRVSGIGCMVQGRTWPDGARQMRRLGLDVDVGLHLNFTEPVDSWGPLYPLHEVLMRSYTGSLDSAAIRASIELQLDHFESAFGRPPHYIDGHQHVHQLPVIRDALLASLTRRYRRPPWVRCTIRRRSASLWRSRDERKAWVIESLGGRALARAADEAGIARNDCFLGVYGFADLRPSYAVRMGAWLDAACARDVLVCHPGVAAEPGDAIGPARVAEFEFLTSDAFAQALADRRIEIRRLPVGGLSIAPSHLQPLTPQEDRR